jgi:hypothetical protein
MPVASKESSLKIVPAYLLFELSILAQVLSRKQLRYLAFIFSKFLNKQILFEIENKVYYKPLLTISTFISCSILLLLICC